MTKTRAKKKPRALRHLAWHLTLEQRPDKSVELRGFEPLTFCMPWCVVSSDGVALGLVRAVESGYRV
jgi:hypothetical protein